jgi:glyoxylase-like metal-dependent hydrolase (beta-lactamase superfamily II)
MSRGYQVGAVTITPLVQFRYQPPFTLFFPQLPPDFTSADWYWQPPYANAEAGTLTIDMGGFLVTTADRAILVDAGLGNDKSRPNPQFDHRDDDWLGQLKEAGAEPGDIDTVIFTHLHIDHVGFATRLAGDQWVPTFGSARYLTTARELDFWTGPGSEAARGRLGDYVGDSVLPLDRAGVLDLVPPDLQVAPEIRLLPAFGHTPGNVCVQIDSQGQRAVFAGDMIHHAIQLAHPDWSTNYCIDDHEATGSRRALLDKLADTGTLFVPAHFPGSTPGFITRDGDAYRFTAAGDE